MSDVDHIINIIKIVRGKISGDTDVVWAGYNGVTQLQTDIDKDLEKLLNGDLNILDAFKQRFMPTATFQEISLSNGWEDEFIELADNFDKLYDSINK